MTVEATAEPVLPAGAHLVPGYVVIAHLHRGDVNDTYDLWSEERACRCVGKTLRLDGRDTTTRRQLLREGELLHRLTHPHLVRAYDVFSNPRPTVILETLPGETLAHILETRGTLPAIEVAFLGAHLCSALHYLHRQEILHLDLTPANVVACQGLAKLVDLSLARAPGRCAGGLGTPGFAAPELWEGGTLTAATDVWGLGALLRDALVGSPPECADAAVPSSGSPRLDTLFAACLSPRPQERPATAEVAEALALVATGTP